MRKMYNVALRRAYQASQLTVDDIFMIVRERHTYTQDTIDYYLNDSSSIISEYTTGVLARAIGADLRKISRDIIAEERRGGLSVDEIMIKYDLSFDEFSRLSNVKTVQASKPKVSIRLGYKPTLDQCAKRAEELGKSYGVYMLDYYSDDIARGIFKPVKQRKGWWQ